nr:ABC transporter ATP-binding protein [Dactylosporangium thailandense]
MSDLHFPGGADIKIRGLSKRFRSGSTSVTAVDQVDMDVAAGSAVAIVGRSGSGKSTLLRLIGGIEAPDSGSIVVGESEITALRGTALAQYRRTVGFVFQGFHLLGALTALDNVLVPLLPQRARFDKVTRARQALEAVGLGDRERSQPSQLSGGQQQRVAIARALAVTPRLLLADEPTGSLDSTTSAEIVDLIMKLRDRHGMTVLLATHEQAIAERCDAIIELRDGEMVQHATVGSEMTRIASSESR